MNYDIEQIATKEEIIEYGLILEQGSGGYDEGPEFTEKEEEGFQELLKLKELEDSGSDKVEIEKQLIKVRAIGKELGCPGKPSKDEKAVNYG